VLLVYALGKAQRVLAGLDPDEGPILLHGAVARLTEIYRAAGIELPPAEYATPERARATRGRALVLAPPSAAGSPWIRKFGAVSTAFASGWMSVRGVRRRRNVDRGFALSDHADWDGLLQAIEATGARRVIAQHGYAESLARWLNESGLEAEAWPDRPPLDEEPTEADG
jgi:putative mRNA 3-end processing factor